MPLSPPDTKTAAAARTKSLKKMDRRAQDLELAFLLSTNPDDTPIRFLVPTIVFNKQPTDLDLIPSSRTAKTHADPTPQPSTWPTSVTS